MDAVFVSWLDGKDQFWFNLWTSGGNNTIYNDNIYIFTKQDASSIQLLCDNVSEEQGLKIQGACITVVGIICPPC